MSTRPEPRGGHAPIVVARRWDQLGGRLNAIVNARAIAELLGLDFGFVWPPGVDPSVPEAGELFTREFLDAFELDESELEPLEPLGHYTMLGLSASAARSRVAETADAFVDVTDLYEVTTAAWEGAAAARSRFISCWHAIGWREPVAQLLRSVAALEDFAAAIHVRAGDIVDGGWDQVLVHEKYMPTPFVEHAVASSSAGGERVVVVSDNAPYLAWLRDRFPATLTAADVIPGYEHLNELERALAEIVLLSRCRRIVGPANSAFSRLAANLGPGEVVRADETVTEGRELDVLRSGIAAHRQDAASLPLWRALHARDICWCLDVFGGELSLDEQRALAREAVVVDPGFGAAAARLARIEALAGEHRRGKRAAAHAVMLAEPVENHDDALLDALASELVVNCLYALRKAPPVLPIARRSDARRRAALLAAINQTLERSLTLTPIWSDRIRVQADLRALAALAAGVLEQSSPVRRRNRAAHAIPGFTSLAEHRRLAIYDPLRRDLDRALAYVEQTPAVPS